MPLTFGSAKLKLSTYGAMAGPYINAAVERMYNSGLWKGTTAAIRATIFDYDDNGVTRRQVTLPRNAETAEGVRFDTDNGLTSARTIHNQWWDWMPGFNCGCSWNSGLIDLGEFATFRDIPVNAQLRIRTDYVESGTMYIRGTNSAGSPIYSGTVPNVITGTTLNLATNPATTTETFLAGSPIEVVIPVTEGRVHLYSWDGTTETLLASYEPGETIPCYRRYQVPNTSGYETAKLKVKLRYVELIADNDRIYPDSFTALAFGCRSWNYSEKHDIERSGFYLEEMFRELNGAQRQHQGVQLPKFSISGPGFAFYQGQ